MNQTNTVLAIKKSFVRPIKRVHVFYSNVYGKRISPSKVFSVIKVRSDESQLLGD